MKKKTWKDYGEVPECGIDQSRWLYMDGRSASPSVHVGSRSDFNVGLKVARARVNCLGRRHLIVAHPNGNLLLMDHQDDRRQRSVASALMALGGELGNKQLCRCEVVQQAFRSYCRSGWSEHLGAIPKPLRPAAKSLHELCSRRSRSQYMPIRRWSCWGDHGSVKREADYSESGRYHSRNKANNPWSQELERRRNAWRGFLERELLAFSGYEFQREHHHGHGLFSLWQANLWDNLYQDGFFYSIIEGEDDHKGGQPRRAVVVSQDLGWSTLDWWPKGFDRRRVMFHTKTDPSQGVPILRCGWAHRGTVMIQDTGQTMTRYYNGGREDAADWLEALGRKAIAKRFKPREQREVKGWIITV